MKLSQAIEIYVSRRHAEGSTYVNGESVLRSLCRQIGDVPLAQLPAEKVSQFLNSARCSPLTRRGKYSMVGRFLEFWYVREEVPLLSLMVPPKVSSSFHPYVFSREQVSKMLAAVTVTQRSSRLVSASTFRMYLLTLYATGAVFNEVLSIRSSQLDFGRCQLILNGDRRTCKRCIPMCPDLARQLEQHVGSLGPDSRLFCSISGGPITSQYLISRFHRLLVAAEVVRNDGTDRIPRMQDFRATFAVHRLTTWLKQGDDLNRLLPSLSAYMGYASLDAAGKYLRLAPDLLLADLKKLSEQSASK
jgi:integrase/recombinase XerD